MAFWKYTFRKLNGKKQYCKIARIGGKYKIRIANKRN